MLSLLQRRSCVLCGKKTTLVCPDCRRLALRVQTPAGLPIFCLGPYGGYLATLIQRFKYGEETFLAHHLGAALGQLHHQLPGKPSPDPDRSRDRRQGELQGIYVPMPLHPERLATRGYNQAALLARAAARQTGSQVDYTTLYRVRNTRAQAHLSRTERHENVLRAFAVRHQNSPPSSVPRLLIDDVLTTGSTIDAAALALQEQDIRVVGGLCLAHKL